MPNDLNADMNTGQDFSIRCSDMQLLISYVDNVILCKFLLSDALNYNLLLNSKQLIYSQVATRWSPQWQARPNEPNLQAILKDHQTQ